MSTFTYDYAESTAVLGPLASTSEPHAYDLCEVHAMNLTAPVGWQIVRLQTTFDPVPPSPDDLMALVDAVRRAAHVDHSSNEKTHTVAHAHYGQTALAHADPGQPSTPTGLPSRKSRMSNAERGPFGAAVAPRESTSKDASALGAGATDSVPPMRHRFHVVEDE